MMNVVTYGMVVQGSRTLLYRTCLMGLDMRSPGKALAGAAAPTLPEIANLEYHLDAALGITLVGDDVDVWADQSGNGHDATDATSKRPLYIAADANLNNKPSVQFDRSNSELLRIASTAGFNSALTIFLVVYLPAPSVDYEGIFSQNQNFNPYWSQTTWVMRTGTPALLCQANDNAQTPVDHSSNQTFPLSAMLTTTFDTNGAELFKSFIGETEIGSTSLTGVLGTANFNVDIGYGNVPDYVYGDSNIAEIIAYTRELTTEERQSVWDYLKSKYAL